MPALCRAIRGQGFVPGIWLAHIVETMVRQWGVGYLKLDGPSLGHYRGARLRDPGMTVVEMIGRSLDVIRAAAGEKVLIEGEGLYGPAIGRVDIRRTTQDPHPSWMAPCART